jgi:hypothetical protein
MLPFLKNKDNSAGIAGTIIKNRAPDEKPEDSDENEYSAADCARDILAAIKMDDAEGLAESLKELFKIADKEPHEEGKHIQPHSYEAQNIKAGQE